MEQRQLINIGHSFREQLYSYTSTDREYDVYELIFLKRFDVKRHDSYFVFLTTVVCCGGWEVGLIQYAPRDSTLQTTHMKFTRKQM